MTTLEHDMRAAAIRAHDEMFRSVWQVPERLRPDEWADRHYQLTSRSAKEPGQWRTSRFPFVRELLIEMGPDSPTQEVSCMYARQLAKTEVILILCGYSTAQNAGPGLLVQPSIPAAKAFVKQRLNPAIDATAVVAAKLKRRRIKDSENTLLTKVFEGGILRVAGANSSSSLRGMPAQMVLCDEIDDYPDDVDHQGDPISIAVECAANFGERRKILLLGNPGVRGHSKSEREFLAGDQRRYFIPCPACNPTADPAGTMDFLTWQGRDWFGAKEGTHHRISWDTAGAGRALPETAHMRCSRCNARVEEGQKTWMLEHGEWRPTAEGDGVRKSYQLSALYSPVGFRSWADNARTFLRAVKRLEQRRDLKPLRAFVNHRLGETWAEPGTSASPKDLLARLEGVAGVVPVGVGVLMAGIDVQGDRLIVAVWGFGVGEEMWLIDAWEIFGKPGETKPKPEDDVWLKLDEQVMRRRWTHANGGRMKVERICVDSGNGNHTDRVYRYCVARQARGVFAIKGGREIGKPLVQKPSPPESNIYGATLYVLCVDSGKYTFTTRCVLPDPGPGYVHIPNFGDPFKNEEVVNQLTSEKLVYGEGDRRKWEPVYPANHWLDATVYAMAGLKIYQGQSQRVNLGERAALAAIPVEAPEAPVEDPTSPAPREPAQVPDSMRAVLRKQVSRGWRKSGGWRRR